MDETIGPEVSKADTENEINREPEFEAKSTESNCNMYCCSISVGCDNFIKYSCILIWLPFIILYYFMKITRDIIIVECGREYSKIPFTLLNLIILLSIIANITCSVYYIDGGDFKSLIIVGIVIGDILLFIISCITEWIEKRLIEHYTS